VGRTWRKLRSLARRVSPQFTGECPSSHTPGEGPHHHFIRTHPFQHPGHGIGGGAGGEDVVDNDPAGVGESGGWAGSEGAPDVFGAFLTGQPGLGGGGVETVDEVGSDGELKGLCEETGKAFGLVEFAFALADGVEGNGDDAGP